jgi:hypothetical protein
LLSAFILLIVLSTYSPSVLAWVLLSQFRDAISFLVNVSQSLRKYKSITTAKYNQLSDVQT